LPFGTISRLVVNRGFGLIREKGTNQEFVFHWASLAAGSLAQLAEGQTIEFDKESDPREPGRTRATNVRLAAPGADH
jgi:cold shock CspA family protein